MFTYAQPQARPTQHISFSLRYRGESSSVSHHFNSLHRGGQYIVSSLSQNDTRSPVLSHMHVQINRSLSHCVSQGNHLEYHIISTLCIEETNTSFHLCLRENDTPNSWASPHRGTQHSNSVSERNPTPNSWASPPHIGAQRSISVLERNHPPISWEQPTYGLSLRSTHSVCVLEDVSCSCNNQELQTWTKLLQFVRGV